MDFLKPRLHRMKGRRRIYEGKAKVLYEGPEPGTLIQYFKDDTTAFNSKKHEVIDGKGVLNNRISEYVFQNLNAIGVPTLQSGTALVSAATWSHALGDRFQIDVADPCAGLRSLLPFLMFSSFFCYFFLPKAWQKWVVFLSAFIFAIAGNIFRIVMLVGSNPSSS